MKMSAKVLNAREVAEAINRLPEEIEGDFFIGLQRAGLLVQRESQKRVPVDTGALRNSARTSTKGQGFGAVVTVGFHTAYAAIVHETHKSKKKFLENTYRELLPEIHKMLLNAMKG